MNDDELFALAKRSDWREGDSISMILRIKYRTPTKIDTIKIKVNGYGYLLSLLYATKDHLYYTVDESGDDYGRPHGSVYRMTLRNGSIDEIVKNISTEDPGMTVIAPHLNLVFSDGTIEDYNINKYVISQNKTDLTDITAAFFSYEHNAFVSYGYSSDLSRWDCFPLAPGGKMPAELRAVPCFEGGSKAK
jgi:hypothetical protein